MLLYHTNSPQKLIISLRSKAWESSSPRLILCEDNIFFFLRVAKLCRLAQTSRYSEMNSNSQQHTSHVPVPMNKTSLTNLMHGALVGNHTQVQRVAESSSQETLIATLDQLLQEALRIACEGDTGKARGVSHPSQQES